MTKSFFAPIFAQFTDAVELHAYAKSLVEEIKTAFEARKAELQEVKTHTEEVAPKAEPKAKKAKGKRKDATPATSPEPTPEPTPTAEDKKASKKEKSADATDEVEYAITEPGLIKKLGLKFERYSEKSWVLRGNTKPIRKALKEQFDGRYNPRLNGGEGWIFNNANAVECAKILGFKVKTA